MCTVVAPLDNSDAHCTTETKRARCRNERAAAARTGIGQAGGRPQAPRDQRITSPRSGPADGPTVRTRGRSTPGGAGPRRRRWSCPRARCIRRCRRAGSAAGPGSSRRWSGSGSTSGRSRPGRPRRACRRRRGRQGGRVQADRARGVAGRVQHGQLDPGDGQHLAVGQLARRVPGRGGSASTAAGRRGAAESGRRCASARAGAASMWSLWAWVHTMAVSAPVADGRRDGVGIVSGVDDDRLVVVADDPHVVVDVPGAAVEARRCRR